MARVDPPALEPGGPDLRPAGARGGPRRRRRGRSRRTCRPGAAASTRPPTGCWPSRTPWPTRPRCVAAVGRPDPTRDAAAGRRARAPRHRHRLRRGDEPQRHPLHPSRPRPDRPAVPRPHRGAPSAVATSSRATPGTLGPSVRAVVPVERRRRRWSGWSRSASGAAPSSEAVAAQLPPLVAGRRARGGAVGPAAPGWSRAGSAARPTGSTPPQLQSMYEYYDAVLHAVREGLLLVDGDGRVQLVNDEAGGCSTCPRTWSAGRSTSSACRRRSSGRLRRRAPRGRTSCT